MDAHDSSLPIRPCTTIRQPPVEHGQRLATFPRPGYHDQPDGELRLTLQEYEDKPFLSLRLWTRGEGGHFWPTAKGVSIRLKEVSGPIQALSEIENTLRNSVPAQQALPGAGRPRRSREPRKGQPYGPQRTLPEANPDLPPAGGFSNNFDECIA
jgi:hypothetical protein